MSTHTPGPWEWKTNISSHQCRLVGSNGTVILIADGVDGVGEDDDLIAAAPDLLAALRNLLAFSPGTSNQFTQAGHAAIAKTEGKT